MNFNTKLANKNKKDKKDNKNMELRNGCANLTCSANHNAGIKRKMVNEKEILSCSNINKVIIRTCITYFPASMRMLHLPEALG